MSQSLASVYVHIVFSTKGRLPLITRDVQGELFSYIMGIARHESSVVDAIGGMPDHVHILATLPRVLALSDLVRILKKASSQWIKVRRPHLADFSWQSGYGAFSVSQSMHNVVSQYILNQEAHHAKQTFQDELRATLNRHKLKFDERYLWE